MYLGCKSIVLLLYRDLRSLKLFLITRLMTLRNFRLEGFKYSVFCTPIFYHICIYSRAVHLYVPLQNENINLYAFCVKIKAIRWCGYKLLRLTYFICRSYILVSRVLHIRSWTGPTIYFSEYSLTHIKWLYQYKVVPVKGRTSTRSYQYEDVLGPLQHEGAAPSRKQKNDDWSQKS